MSGYAVRTLFSPPTAAPTTRAVELAQPRRAVYGVYVALLFREDICLRRGGGDLIPLREGDTIDFEAPELQGLFLVPGGSDGWSTPGFIGKFVVFYEPSQRIGRVGELARSAGRPLWREVTSAPAAGELAVHSLFHESRLHAAELTGLSIRSSVAGDVRLGMRAGALGWTTSAFGMPKTFFGSEFSVITRVGTRSDAAPLLTEFFTIPVLANQLVTLDELDYRLLPIRDALGQTMVMFLVEGPIDGVLRTMWEWREFTILQENQA